MIQYLRIKLIIQISCNCPDACMQADTFICAATGAAEEEKTLCSNGLVQCATTEVPHAMGGYNVPNNPSYAMIADCIFHLFGNTKDKPRILDIGAGRGTCLEVLASDPRFLRCPITYRAIEMVQEMCALLLDLAGKVKLLSPKSEFKRNTEANLDFFPWVEVTKDEPYDVVTAQLFLHYCPFIQIPLFFDHMLKLLKPGGNLFMTVTMNGKCKELKVTTEIRKIGKTMQVFPEGYSPELLEMFLKDWGFTVQKCEIQDLPTNLNGQETVMPVILVHAILNGTQNPELQAITRECSQEITQKTLDRFTECNWITLEEAKAEILKETDVDLTVEECHKISKQPGGIPKFIEELKNPPESCQYS